MCVVMDVEAAKIWRFAVLFLPPSPSLSLCVCACILYVCFTLVCPCLLYLFGGFRDTGPRVHVCVCSCLQLACRNCCWHLDSLRDVLDLGMGEFCLFMNHSLSRLSLPLAFWSPGPVHDGFIYLVYTRPYRACSFGSVSVLCISRST